MKNIQLGISGVAENKEYDAGTETSKVVRNKLANLISSKLQTNKIGFANMLKISPATVTKWLCSYTQPSTEMVKLIARKLGMSAGEVFDLFED